MFNRYNKLMTAVALILITGFLATSVISYRVSLTSLRAEITSSSLPLTSDNIYSEIQRDLLPPIFISSLMANDTFVRDWVLQGEKNESEISRYLKEIKVKYATITSFFVSEKTGNYYYSEGILKTINPKEVRDEWYYRLEKLQANYEINIDPDLANKNTMTIFINYKVFDYQNRFIGATGVGLNVNAVKKLITDYQEKYKRNIFFIDPHGNITIRSSVFPDRITTIFNIEGIKNHAEQILSTTGDTFSYKRDKKNYFLNTRYIKEFDWYLLVEENENMSTGVLFRTLLINIFISLVITCILFFLIKMQINSYQEKIENLARTDKLTDLYNRQAFDSIMEQSLKEKKRTKIDIALIMLDLDFFKKVNDTHGHLCGDKVLIQSTKRIKSVLREVDVLCRWGGEEFFVLMKGCNQTDAYKMAEKIRHSFSDTLFKVGDIVIPLTVSIGVTALEETDSYQTSVERADKALYMAKSSGRNRTEIV